MQHVHGGHYAGTLALGVLLIGILGSCGTAAPAGGARGVPYGIDKRPMPTGTDLEALVPPVVGTWTREPFPAGTQPSSDEDINATYTSGGAEVTIGFSIQEDAAGAHAAIETTREEAITGNIPTAGEQFSLGTEPSYFKLASFISWSRGPYFYYAHASDAAALDSFMAAFPY